MLKMILSRVAARWLGLAVVVLALVLGSALFLPRQSLWLDEATQMSGLALDPVGVVGWLLGGDRRDFGQLRDRMPPLSYWLGWSWSRVFGADETSLRWFGVTCVAIAAGLVYEAARLAHGTVAGWIAGLLFALSPAVVLLSVEIRAYPLFLLWSSAAWYLLVRWRAVQGGPRWPTGLALALVLAAAVATHFFGVILAAAVLLSLVVFDRSEGERLFPIIGVGAVVAIAVLGILPFVWVSMNLYRHGPDHFAGMAARLKGLKNLLAGQVGHVTLTVYRPVETIALLVGAFLVVLAIRSSWISRRDRARAATAIALALAIGFVAVAVAKIGLGRFDATTPNYNAWMRPGVCLLLASGIASRELWARRAALSGSMLLLLAQTTGVYQLAAHGDHFAHGPHGVISRMIRGLDSRDIAVVHDEPSSDTIFIYSPLRYERGPALDQYVGVAVPDGTYYSYVYPAQLPAQPVASLPHRYLLVVHPRPTSPHELVSQVRNGDRSKGPGPLARQLLRSDGWQLVSERVAVALISAEIDLFERRGTAREDRSHPQPAGSAPLASSSKESIDARSRPISR